MKELQPVHEQHWFGRYRQVAATGQLKQFRLQKDEFVSEASHELKTPITSIKVYGKMVEKELHKKGDEENAQLLARLNKQGNRLKSLVVHLLDTTAISEGQLELYPGRYGHQ